MSFKNCPECGETNYYQVGYIRYFDCGFAGDKWDTRTARCAAFDDNPRPQAGQLPLISDEAACYRLALLDGAQAIDGLAADMEADELSGNYAQSCRELAQQLRAFAGHDTGLGWFAGNRRRGRKRTTGLLTVIKKVTPW